jgi:hypothetical protein
MSALRRQHKARATIGERNRRFEIIHRDPHGESGLQEKAGYRIGLELGRLLPV